MGQAADQPLGGPKLSTGEHDLLAGKILLSCSQPLKQGCVCAAWRGLPWSDWQAQGALQFTEAVQLHGM